MAWVTGGLFIFGCRPADKDYGLGLPSGIQETVSLEESYFRSLLSKKPASLLPGAKPTAPLPHHLAQVPLQTRAVR